MNCASRIPCERSVVVEILRVKQAHDGVQVVPGFFVVLDQDRIGNIDSVVHALPALTEGEESSGQFGFNRVANVLGVGGWEIEEIRIDQVPGDFQLLI